jgi:hypothetical protein
MTDQNILNSVPSITVKSAQFSKLTGDVYRWSDMIWRSVNDVKELVELRKANAELKKEREWIDVIDELPKTTMSVLVTDGVKVGELTYVKYVNGTGKWAGNNEDITAWMLKPKSPEAPKE